MEKINFNDQLGKKYQDILALSDEPMGFVKSEVPSVGWWDKNNIWVIEYANEEDLIHELGHIQFDNNRNHYTTHVDGKNSIDFPLNAIMDIFVDYRLSKSGKYPGYYEYFLHNHLETIGKSSNKKKLSEFGLQVEMGSYCFFYLFSRYVLEKSDKNNQVRFKIYLKNSKHQIILGLKLSNSIFNNVEEKLDCFPEVKDTKNMREVAEYILQILYASGLWDKKEIYTVLKAHLL